MRRILLAAAACATLAGCLSVPQTTAELRGHSMVRSETIDVGRSASAAFSTIANRSRSCLNFGSHTQLTRAGTMNANFIDHYRTRTEGRSLVLEHNSPNNVGNPGWYPRLVADVTPTATGARITTYAPIGDGIFVRAIQAWARGDTSPCPRNDLF